ncbi:MAG TPA: DNA-formamidopyrimidine glycosylase family protein [Lacipirellulaceae bacterium]|nr:DNA-formamidopyrimidine glycosylase family protein [Lacipirellulaceae bacterium]
MPELPDVVVYCNSLNRFYAGRVVERVALRSPFVVRTVEPDLFAVEGRRVVQFSRLGKRIVWEFEGALFLVLHLMIAGRLHQKPAEKRPAAKNDLAAFYFGARDGPAGALFLTEASPKKRASIHMAAGAGGLAAYQRGGLEVLDATLPEFRARIQAENHTLKRGLTSPALFSGIGNAYSDEILHAARLSPVKLTSRLTGEEIQRLFVAIQETLRTWVERLGEQAGAGFPERVSAFHPAMAVHGRFGQPCPVCGARVQRIRYADRETNYCAVCQTEGKVLADRSLSRLLKDDWPRTIEEWEAEF